MNETSMPVVQPLGDSGLLVSWGNVISRELNDKVIALMKALQDKPFEGMIDCVPAYSSLAVLYDVALIDWRKGESASVYEFVKLMVEDQVSSLQDVKGEGKRLMEVPVCYDEILGNDIATISRVMNVSKEEVTELHASRTYHVYMPGFIPGFVYMGEVDRRIAIPRKSKPETVRPGAVAIAGIQTGIYPSVSPGGWHIVGYTALQMFDPDNDDPCLLRAGDEVQFVSISANDYRKMLNQ